LLLCGVCARALAAEAFSAFVDFGLLKTLEAFDAALGLVWPLLPAACDNALAAADFSALVDLGLAKTFEAFDAAGALVCLLFLVVMSTTVLTTRFAKQREPWSDAGAICGRAMPSLQRMPSPARLGIRRSNA
jgi:hypothetical protein